MLSMTTTQAAQFFNVNVHTAMDRLVKAGIAKINPDYAPNNTSDKKMDTVKHLITDRAFLKGFTTENLGFVAPAKNWKMVLGA